MNVDASWDQSSLAIKQLGGTEASSLQDAHRIQDENQHGDSLELREAFDDFVGQTFFAHLLKAMRQTTEKPAYFHGGRAEEVFQAQLDQHLVEEVSESSAKTFTEPMFELFSMSRY